MRSLSGCEACAQPIMRQLSVSCCQLTSLPNGCERKLSKGTAAHERATICRRQPLACEAHFRVWRSNLKADLQEHQQSANRFVSRLQHTSHLGMEVRCWQQRDVGLAVGRPRVEARGDVRLMVPLLVPAGRYNVRDMRGQRGCIEKLPWLWQHVRACRQHQCR
jgi:hypothetical protein